MTLFARIQLEGARRAQLWSAPVLGSLMVAGAVAWAAEVPGLDPEAYYTVIVDPESN